MSEHLEQSECLECLRCGRQKATKRDVDESYDKLRKGRCFDGIDWDDWLRPSQRDGVSVSAETVQELLGEVAQLRALLRQADCRRATAERALLGILNGVAELHATGN